MNLPCRRLASHRSQNTLVEDGHFGAAGFMLKLLHDILFFRKLCHLQLYTYSATFFRVKSMGLTASVCVNVIFAYWPSELMASLTIVTVVLNGILLDITRFELNRFVLCALHPPTKGTLVMGLKIKRIDNFRCLFFDIFVKSRLGN